MKIKWLTKEEVRAYATTPERALEISERHHQQIVDATEEELKEYGGKLLDGYLCGLCHYYSVLGNGRCGACPLDKDGGRCGNLGSLWRNAEQAFINHPFNHKAFIKAETALLNRLKQLKSGDKSMKKTEQEIRTRIDEVDVCLEKLRDEERDLKRQLAEEEVTYSVGDKFMSEDGKECLLIRVKSDYVLLVNMANGNRFMSSARPESPTKVRRTERITQSEFSSTHTKSPMFFTRYWDARKKVRCG